MPLQIVQNDITRMACDAIVNAANERLLGGGGVDGAIHRAAGEKLLTACRALGGCKTGDVKLTKGYNLPCKYILHTVGPIWHGGTAQEALLLTACYRKSLELAVKKRCKSIAFPLISTGAYGYPMEQALQIAIRTIREFLSAYRKDLQVYLVVFDKAAYAINADQYGAVQSYINDHYAAVPPYNPPYPEQYACSQEPILPFAAMPPSMDFSEKYAAPSEASPSAHRKQKRPSLRSAAPQIGSIPGDLRNALQDLDESFTQMLLRKIDESGMTDAACYKKANIDRKLFSKIRKDWQYRPKKVTVIAFALALELNLDETQSLLNKAGYALSHSSKFDIIVEYFISRGEYDVFTINEVLFAFDQSLIGA